MEQILSGFTDILTIANFFYIALGTTIGIFIGAIPGLGPNMAIAIVIPITFYMEPLAAIALLVGLMKGGTYGGAISAIVLNTPGTPDAAATCLDGYPLAKQGKPEKALKMALYSSCFGDTFSDLVLILVAASIAVLALKMGPAEVTSMIVFALTIIAAVSGKSLLKALMAASFGILLSSVGMDPLSGDPRLNFGSLELEDGFPMVALFIGMLALSEVLVQMEQHKEGGTAKPVSFDKNAKKEDRSLSFHEFKGTIKTMFRSSLIGTGIGALPGLGYTLAAFLGYAAAKRASKHPEEFGKGSLEGIAAAEAANNAVVGANLIPLFTLGIPGNVSAALLIGVFMIHGVTPGPLMFQEHGRFVYGIYGALIVGNIFNLVIGSLGLRLFARVLLIPKQIVFPIICILCFTGVYVSSRSLFTVGLTVVFAIIGYFMKRLDLSFVAFIIGYILGPILEFNLRRTLVISQNSPLIFITHPISLAFLILTAFAVWKWGFRSKERGSSIIESKEQT